MKEIWTISNQNYQERFWVRKEHPIYDDENCMKTVGEFLTDVTTVLLYNEKGLIPLTSKQRKMVETLHKMIKDFTEDPSVPDNPGFGINDAEIIKHPKWEKIRDCAKFVYEGLTIESL